MRAFFRSSFPLDRISYRPRFLRLYRLNSRFAGGQVEQRREVPGRLIGELSQRLASDFGHGFDKRNVWFMRSFYLTYPKVNALRSELTWTHYRLLLRVDKAEIRELYMNEAINSNWSTRGLERQMSSLLFVRLALSKDKEDLLRLSREGQVPRGSEDLVKDPYVLEFLGLEKQRKACREQAGASPYRPSAALSSRVGQGARQQRITLGGDHFYIDLVFYNRLTKSFVLIDLKVGKLSHQDIGQMQMYVNYYKRTQMVEGENPPIGIILCAGELARDSDRGTLKCQSRFHRRTTLADSGPPQKRTHTLRSEIIYEGLYSCL